MVYFIWGGLSKCQGNFHEAAESYNSYTEQVGKKAAKEMGVPEFITAMHPEERTDCRF